jgi:glutamate formiminotransferase
MGVSLAERGLVQVSMNLTHFEQTPIHTVFDRVVAEAAKEGVNVEESEIVGLIPAAALAATSAAHLRLKNFSADRILEHRLASAVQRR